MAGTRWSTDDLADDATAPIQHEAGKPLHFVGLSMGGMVAQSLAARHPSAVTRVVIADSASHHDDAARTPWQARVRQVRNCGVGSVADGAVEHWFAAGFRTRSTNVVAAVCACLVRTDAAS